MMARGRRTGFVIMLLSTGLFVFLGLGLERSTPQGMLDFKVLYNGARCLTHHCDPYNVNQLQQFFEADGLVRPSDPPVILHVVIWYVYLPTTFLFTAPFSMLSWGLACVLWTTITAGSLTLAAFLIWDLAANDAPVLSACLIGFLLAGSEVIFAGGNAVGIVVSLCIIAVWCFLKDRFVTAGVVFLAISLVIKPHDAGLVWLYFLLAGGAYRKRALQTLAITAVLGLVAFVWVSEVSPHWLQEMTYNLSTISSHGDMNDPGPGSSVDRTSGMVIDLQSVVSIFRNDPRFYNPVSYLSCGALILIWSLVTLARPSSANAWFALAAVVPLSMLLIYHKPYDAKLALLAIPACATLWIEGGPIGAIALSVTSVAVVFAADVTRALFVILTRDLHPDTSQLFGKILLVLISRPLSIILLVMALFYLWVYVRRTAANVSRT